MPFNKNTYLNGLRAMRKLSQNQVDANKRLMLQVVEQNARSQQAMWDQLYEFMISQASDSSGHQEATPSSITNANITPNSEHGQQHVTNVANDVEATDLGSGIDGISAEELDDLLSPPIVDRSTNNPHTATSQCHTDSATNLHSSTHSSTSESSPQFTMPLPSRRTSSSNIQKCLQNAMSKVSSQPFRFEFQKEYEQDTRDTVTQFNESFLMMMNAVLKCPFDDDVRNLCYCMVSQAISILCSLDIVKVENGKVKVISTADDISSMIYTVYNRLSNSEFDLHNSMYIKTNEQILVFACIVVNMVFQKGAVGSNNIDATIALTKGINVYGSVDSTIRSRRRRSRSTEPGTSVIVATVYNYHTQNIIGQPQSRNNTLNDVYSITKYHDLMSLFNTVRSHCPTVNKRQSNRLVVNSIINDARTNTGSIDLPLNSGLRPHGDRFF